MTLRSDADPAPGLAEGGALASVASGAQDLLLVQAKRAPPRVPRTGSASGFCDSLTRKQHSRTGGPFAREDTPVGSNISPHAVRLVQLTGGAR